ncbi:MAG: patatin-like phospholipase family protein [Eubacteriaceae bacterium]
MEYGLVLSGGGAKGSFEVGVWKALREMNIVINAVAGTSVGALNGAVIAQNEFEGAVDFWTNLTIDQVFNVNKQITSKFVTDWSKSDFESFSKSFKSYLFEGGLDTTPLRKNLAKYINEDKIRKSDIRLGIVTVSLNNFKPLELMIEKIPEGKLMDYLLASAAFPTFKKHQIDGDTFIDGGLYDNLPINLLASEGYHNLITVDLPAPGFKAKLKYDNLNIENINNSEYLGLILDFNQKIMRKNIQIGYLDTLKKFGKLHGTNYYITLNKDDSILKNFNSRLGTFLKGENGIKLPLLLGIDDVLSKSELLNEISRFIGYTQYKGQDQALNLIEITASNLSIDRLKIYTPNQLIKEIFVMVNSLLDENINLIKNTNTVLDIFKSSTELTVNPLTNMKFIASYMYFLSLNPNSINPLNKLISRLSPEIILAIITLLYLTNS